MKKAEYITPTTKMQEVRTTTFFATSTVLSRGENDSSGDEPTADDGTFWGGVTYLPTVGNKQGVHHSDAPPAANIKFVIYSTESPFQHYTAVGWYSDSHCIVPFEVKPPLFPCQQVRGRH